MMKASKVSIAIIASISFVIVCFEYQKLSTSRSCNTWQQVKPRKHDTNQLLILNWKRSWNNENLQEKYSSNKMCKWTYDKCLLPSAHVVVFSYDEIYAKDMPWKFYRFLLN